jgi:hypothetical protein
MTVSLARAVRRRTKVNSRAKTTANSTANHMGSAPAKSFTDAPSRVPMAMPVKAEWPSASEKKDMRLSTTMVDSRPNRGEMTSTASRAFFIKNMLPGWAQSKGSRSTREYHSAISAPPPSQREVEDLLEFRGGEDLRRRARLQHSLWSRMTLSAYSSRVAKSWVDRRMDRS